MNGSVVEIQEAEKAPVSERPNQINDTTHKTSAKEDIAREAIRAALYACGIDHDCLEFIAEGCLKALKGAGLIGKSLMEVVETVEPEATASVHVAIFPRWIGRNVNGFLGHHGPRSRAQAEKVANAIRAEYGGELKDCPDPHTSTLDVEIRNSNDMVKYVRHSVYYDLPEEPES